MANEKQWTKYSYGVVEFLSKRHLLTDKVAIRECTNRLRHLLTDKVAIRRVDKVVKTSTH